MDARPVRAALIATGIDPGRRHDGAVAVLRGQQAGAIDGLRLDGVEMQVDPDAHRFSTNRSRAYRMHEGLRAQVLEIRDGPIQDAASLLADPQSLDVLDEHQVRNVAAMTLSDCYGFCLFDEQGAGKTVSVIYAWDQLVARGFVDTAIVVAPKSMVPEWKADLERFTGGLYRCELVSGTRREKQRVLRERSDVYVTNFETVVSLRDELTALARSRGEKLLLVVDESFMVKNLDTGRSRALRYLREWCGRCFVLCGTPAPNSAHDLAGQFTLADLGVTFDGVEIPEDRPAAHKIVQEAIDTRGIYLRNLKQDVLPDLPTKRFDVVAVPLEPRQQDLYDRLAVKLRADAVEIDEEEFARQRASFMARRSALLQICSSPRSVDETYDRLPAKLQALDHLLAQLQKAGKKAVIWSFFTASIDSIASRYSQFGIVRYDGQVPEVAARREAVRRFQTDDSIRLMVANPAAAGAGLTLTAAHTAIYESFSPQAAHYLQSLDRIHRRGQDSDVRYVILLGENTVEEAEYKRLRDKEVAAQALLGDDITPPLTRQLLIEELSVVPAKSDQGALGGGL